MQTLALRDFQRGGASALKHPCEPALLAGRNEEYVLFPVPDDDREDLMQSLENVRALALFRHGQRVAAAAGGDLLTDADVDAEIKASRNLRRAKKTGNQ